MAPLVPHNSSRLGFPPGVADAGLEAALERIARLAARITGASAAFVALGRSHDGGSADQHDDATAAPSWREPVVARDGQWIGELRLVGAPVNDDTREEVRDLAALAADEVELWRAREHLARADQERTYTRRALRDSQAVAQTLLGVSTLMALDLPPAEVARHALELVARVSDVDWCGLMTVRGDEAWCEAAWARDGAGETFGASLPPQLRREWGGLLWRIAEQGEPYFSGAYEREPNAQAAIVAAGLRAAAWLPLGRYDGAAYVVVFGRVHRSRAWSAQDRGLFEAAAHFIRQALEARERAHLVQRSARTDALTGLGNRRAFDEAVRAAVETSPFNLVLFDLDGLKLVNDTMGHAAGDTLLRVFASALSADLPEGASAYRFGGDEFAVLLPSSEGGSMQDATIEALDLLDRAVSATRAAGYGRAATSFGVARWPDEAATPGAALALADARLYEDKRARRGSAIDADLLSKLPRLHRNDRADLASDAPLPESVVRYGDLVLNERTGIVQSLRAQSPSAQLDALDAALLAMLARTPERVFRSQELGRVLELDANDVQARVAKVQRTLANVTVAVTVRTVGADGVALHAPPVQDG